MTFHLTYSPQPVGNTLPCLVLFLASDHDLEKSHLTHLPKAIQTAVANVLKLKDFSGKKGVLQVLFPQSTKIDRVVLAGLGDAKTIDAEVLRHTAGKVGQYLAKQDFSEASCVLPSFLKKSMKSSATTALAEGLVLGGYEFTQFKTSPKKTKKSSEPKEITFLDPEEWSSESAMLKGVIRGEATNYARDFGNMPANYMTPALMADAAKVLADSEGLELTVLEEEDLDKLGMHMFLGVSRGSVEPAKLIILEHKPARAKETIAFVGKGITFDAGGISLKPGKGMDEMKFDMCGSAAVLGAMKAVAKLNPKYHIIGAIAASENLPSGDAQKPGDVVTSYSGKTVEILNTDAEGRLVLGDTLTYVEKKYKPKAMIDLATLTGACITALGRYATGCVGNDDELIEQIVTAGKSSGERVWPLPNFPEYEEALKGKYADLKNLGDGTAGTIAGGMFLKQFVQKTPWLHLDIAGTGWNVKGPGYLPNDGATGVGVRLLLDFLEQ